MNLIQTMIFLPTNPKTTIIFFLLTVNTFRFSHINAAARLILFFFIAYLSVEFSGYLYCAFVFSVLYGVKQGVMS